MSESREKRKRYNQKLECIALFDKWVAEQPPMWRVFKWRKWIKSKPQRREVEG